MSEGQKNWGITVLVLEVKRIGNVAKWSFLLQGIKYVTWRTLENADLSISSQVGLFSTFLQVISFLQVKLASQKDNCKSYIPAFVAKIRWYLSRNSNKIKNSHVQNFLFLDKIQRTSKGSDLSKKRMGSPCI